MGKVMEKMSVGMTMALQDMSNYKKDSQTIQFQLCKQDIRLERIQRHFPCIIDLADIPGDSAKDLAPVESTSEDQQD